ncbi:hypothetical protein [Cupriavidus pauculus]|uniref:hypothetical protein n=1 Tax=Cupriavidus pauculus TaxID=82633 RepID=UPI0012462214|nr:hypothetical protein [Cupriavidus pauculus]KAB0600396.1 hypothetical protein F7R19_21575 [Cupriavidus pauculus]MBY4733433.1 hypothetical protein [Cupriavidus pauculus]UAL03829.1 hypothetical protein K8O84_28295 [Cupriavidus pauculus]
MTRKKYGIQIFDETGAPVLEVGPHLIRESPKFAEKIGTIAASWAHAEVNLNCYFAILLDTTPEEAAKHLTKHKSAARATTGARKVAEVSLSGTELAATIAILDNLDEVRVRRNRIQHDVWAKKGSDDQRIFAIHADQYLSFTTAVVAIQESAATQSEQNARVIALANEFAADVSNGYSVQELDKLDHDVDLLSQSLVTAMFSRIARRLAKVTESY